jgi:hypothetical protein
MVISRAISYNEFTDNSHKGYGLSMLMLPRIWPWQPVISANLSLN